MATYYDKVLEQLDNVPITIEELIIKMNLPKTKQTYIIDAIKKGISKKTMIQIPNKDEKRLYLGHTYIKGNKIY
jgi:hypothetical protein